MVLLLRRTPPQVCQGPGCQRKTIVFGLVERNYRVYTDS